MTYSELVQQVKDYLKTTETTFNSNIDTFIKLAEEDICRKAPRLPVFRKNSASSLTASNAYLTVPSDFLAPYELAVINSSSYVYLLKKDVSFIREANPVVATTGVPKYYAVFDSTTLIVGPTPSSGFSTELHYYAIPTSIVSASTTWIGDNAPNALLWGTVLQGYAFLKGSEDLVKLYTEAYTNAISSLKQLEELEGRDRYRYGRE